MIQNTPHCSTTLAALGCWNPAVCRLYTAQRTTHAAYVAALTAGDEAEINRTERLYDDALDAVFAHRRGVAPR